jgi:hypothetical protein
MQSSGMCRYVDIVQTDVSEERIASIFRGSLQPRSHAGSPLADFSTSMMEAIRSSETSVHTISTQLHVPEDDILLLNVCRPSYFTNKIVCTFIRYPCVLHVRPALTLLNTVSQIQC